LYSLGPLVSEKVIGREIGNYRDRTMDQTPSGGASIVNRTLCNDDTNVNAKPKKIDVTYELSVSEEAVNEITERKYEEFEVEASLKTTVTAGYTGPSFDPTGVVPGSGMSASMRTEAYLGGKVKNEDETTKT
jgi:hypothetical protein